MKRAQFATLLLAAFLNFVPFVSRSTASVQILYQSPLGIVMKWAVSTLACAGTYHAVSAASAVLASATNLKGTAGTRLSHQIKISDGTSRLPESWEINGRVYGKIGSTAFGMPPGLSLGLGTGIISGVPTQGGTFAVDITVWEKPELSGAQLSFTLTFNITGGASPPTISQQPQGITIIEGSRFELKVLAEGTAPLVYQWRRNGTSIPGANSAILVLNSVQPSDEGDYVVVISNSAGSVASAVAKLTVTASAQGIAIQSHPVSVQRHTGEPITLAVEAMGPQPLNFQWRRNGMNLLHETSAVLTIPTAGLAHAGTYDAVVTSGSDSITSAPATVTVVPLTIHIVDITDEGVRLGLQSIPGREYVLEGTGSGLSSDWQVLTQTVASEGLLTFQDPQSQQGLRFWRYRVSPEAGILARAPMEGAGNPR